jgi:hypothetical protein
MEVKIDLQARGTRLLIGETANKRRSIIDSLINIAIRRGLH